MPASLFEGVLGTIRQEGGFHAPCPVPNTITRDPGLEVNMTQMIVSTRIDAPVDKVFAACTDFANLAHRIDAIQRIEMLNDGPVGVGTRFRETRVMFKREATEEMEVSAFETGRSYTLACDSCGCAYEFTHRFKRDGDATLIEMDMKTRPISFFAKLMSPFGKLMMGTMKKCIQKDMEDLRASIE